jgi:streptogramin lyase
VVPVVPVVPVIPGVPVTTYSGYVFSGSVLAGTQPVVGATLSLYAAGTTGNGSAPTLLLTTSLLSDANGAFAIPGSYACPTGDSQLYLLARGGKVGALPANAALTFLTTLGTCSQVATSSSVVLNEVTTVVNAWALSQFLAAGGNIGASGTNATGLANAVATAASLVNPVTGTAPGAVFPANGIAPRARINSLANLLNTCSIDGLSASSSGSCGLLFNNATLSGSSAPDNTLDAVLNIVRHPASNVGSLYVRSGISSAFAPALGKAPSDWSLFVNFTGAGMSSPAGIAVDSSGSVWVSSYFSAASKFSPTGAPVFAKGITGYGLGDSYGVAIDSSDNVWIPNQESPGNINSGLGSVTMLNSSGQSLSGANGFTSGGMNYPVAIAIDPNSTAWVLDFGNAHLTQLSKSGAPLSGTTGYTSPSFVFPVALAVDASHNVWVANQSDITVTKVSQDGKTFTDYACCNGPSGLAIDPSGNVWVANFYGDSVSEISSTGSIVSSGGYTSGGSIVRPQGIASDGAGNIWVANFRATYLTELAGASSANPGQPISPANVGWAADSKLAGAFAVAVDASGNVWVTNFNNDSITEFIGMASPVRTPMIGPVQTP